MITTESSKDEIASFLRNLNDRAKGSHESGNQYASAYLACIGGMWGNYLNISRKRNPFTGQNDIELWKWWDCGHACYDQAIGLANRIRREMTEKEGANSKKKTPQATNQIKAHALPPTANSDVKRSLWNVKLW
jgi:hypothetical protein